MTDRLPSRAAPVLAALCLVVAAACSSPTQAPVDAAATAIPLPSVHASEPPPVATTTRDEPSAPHPLEAWHDAEAMPPHDDDGFRPHRLKVLVDDQDRPANAAFRVPYVSEDGSTVQVIHIKDEPDPRMDGYTLVVWPLDAPERAQTLVFLEQRLCNSGPDAVPCDHPRAVKAVQPINALLAKHRWIEFQEYDPWPEGVHGDYCGRTLRARAAGYSLEFRSPRLTIAAPDGTVFVERADVVARSRTGQPSACSSADSVFLGRIGVNLSRRAMFVEFGACNAEDCRPIFRNLFFRLPKPTPTKTRTP